jgi:hypothetical protein
MADRAGSQGLRDPPIRLGAYFLFGAWLRRLGLAAAVLSGLLLALKHPAIRGDGGPLALWLAAGNAVHLWLGAAIFCVRAGAFFDPARQRVVQWWVLPLPGLVRFHALGAFTSVGTDPAAPSDWPGAQRRVGVVLRSVCDVVLLAVAADQGGARRRAEVIAQLTGVPLVDLRLAGPWRRSAACPGAPGSFVRGPRSGGARL